MDYINKNLKKAGIFNSVLIAIGVIYDIVRLFSVNRIDGVVCIILQLIAFGFALFYAFRGYKKNAAKYYKSFLYVFALSSVASLVSTFIAGRETIIQIIPAILGMVCIIILALVQNLGKKRSYILSIIVFITSVITIIVQLISFKELRPLIVSLSTLILSTVLCVFIVAKYKDKESRGTK